MIKQHNDLSIGSIEVVSERQRSPYNLGAPSLHGVHDEDTIGSMRRCKKCLVDVVQRNIPFVYFLNLRLGFVFRLAY